MKFDLSYLDGDDVETFECNGSRMVAGKDEMGHYSIVRVVRHRRKEDTWTEAPDAEYISVPPNEIPTLAKAFDIKTVEVEQ